MGLATSLLAVRTKALIMVKETARNLRSNAADSFKSQEGLVPGTNFNSSANMYQINPNNLKKWNDNPSDDSFLLLKDALYPDTSPTGSSETSSQSHEETHRYQYQQLPGKDTEQILTWSIYQLRSSWLVSF
jgi:hypothetical protein